MPITKITARTAIKFIYGIICFFAVPNCIITDNGKQLTSDPFTEYCKEIRNKL